MEAGNRRMCHCEDVFDPAGYLERVVRGGMGATVCRLSRCVEEYLYIIRQDQAGDQGQVNI